MLTLVITLCAYVITRTVARGAWAHRAPCAAVTLWVVAMLAVPLAALSAIITEVVDRHTWQSAYLLPVIATGGSIALLLALSARVARAFVAINASAREQRRRHAMLIDLFTTPHPQFKHVVVLPDGHLFAYSLPCAIWGRIVISEGALAHLDAASLQAVLAHERAHLAARHHLVLQLAAAIAEVFPRTARGLPQRLADVAEMAADCHARRTAGQQPTVRALTALAAMRAPAAALGAGGRAIDLRLSHLCSGRLCCATAKSFGAFGIALALLALPAVLVAINLLVDLCPWTYA
jgi:hypothetical protein